MTFAARLLKSKDAIVTRWLDDLLATYSEDSSALFRGQKDRFANPVGQNLRTATREIVEALLDGADDERIGRHLHEIVKIRAVQQFTASGAVGFVFQLKEAIRAELGKEVLEPGVSSELAGLEKRIDRMALVAFDIFVECREQVFELRVNEVKRSVSWAADRMKRRGVEPEPVDSR